jgi:hypothetical protein
MPVLLVSMACLVGVVPVRADGPFSFAVTGDLTGSSGHGERDTCEFFRGVCEAVGETGLDAFMISVGDVDPVGDVRWTIDGTLGASYLWYPVVGNHDLPGDGVEAHRGENMEWLRSYDYDSNGRGSPPDVVNTGPKGCRETTYSFDFENAHFVVLNEYCNTGGDSVTKGLISYHLYNWLADDLAASDKPVIFVFGHEPAYPQPDRENGRLRHKYDSLNRYRASRDRFWRLLRDEGVTAYICGHTHNHSVVNIDGVWQVDAGHARGKADTGARSTFIRIHVGDNQVSYKTYRVSPDDHCEYLLTHSGALNRPADRTAPAERGRPILLQSVGAALLALVAAVLIVAAAGQLARSRGIMSESRWESPSN